MKRTVWIVAVAALCVAGSAVAQDRSGQYLGNGGRVEDAGQTVGSGGYLGSGNRTTDASGGLVGSGTRTADAGGGLIGSGTRSEDSGQVIGSGSSVTAEDGGYLIGGDFGSGLLVLQLRLWDGASLLVVSWDEGMLVIPIEE